MVYLISYDLVNPGQKYTELHDKIKSFGTYDHVLESTWLIVTNWTALQVRDYIKPPLDNNDRVLIIEVKANYEGWLAKEHWDWIKKHLR